MSQGMHYFLLSFIMRLPPLTGLDLCCFLVW